MTIEEAIAQIDSAKPNSYTQKDKILWLSELDGRVKRQIIDKHDGGDAVEFNGYDDNVPLDTVLLIYEPYTNAYVTWLESKIHYANEEYAKYNNSITLFNDVFDDFAKDYNRTHMPKGVKFKYW